MKRIAITIAVALIPAFIAWAGGWDFERGRVAAVVVFSAVFVATAVQIYFIETRNSI